MIKQEDWKFEISSGYNGYRNIVTGEWIYEPDYIKKFSDSKQNTLEEEAQEYAENDDTRSYDFCNQTLVDTFLEGANSKWVQREKVKAQIEILSLIQSNLDGNNTEQNNLWHKINQIKKTLKNETRTN